MDKQALQRELTQLRSRLDSELARAKSRRDPFGHLLQRLAVQADPSEPEPLDNTLLAQLRDSVAEQEAEHPQLAAVARQLLDLLSRMGV